MLGLFLADCSLRRCGTLIRQFQRLPPATCLLRLFLGGYASPWGLFLLKGSLKLFRRCRPGLLSLALHHVLSLMLSQEPLP